MFSIDKSYYEAVKDLPLTHMVEYENNKYNTVLLTNPIITIYLYIENNNILLFKPLTYKPIKTNSNNTTGYKRLSIPKHFRFTDKTSLYVHQLIAMFKYKQYLFVLNHKFEVDHIDGNKENNAVDNIQLLTKYDNLFKRTFNNKTEYIASFHAFQILENDFNNLYIDKAKKLLLHPVDLKYKLYKVIKPTNNTGNYVITDKNKRLRNININKVIKLY